MKYDRTKQNGVTLIEIMLVLVIMTTMLVMFMGYMNRKTSEARRDRMVLQMDQILNSGLAFYINNGKWPSAGVVGAGNDLVTQGYLPNTLINSPYGKSYVVTADTVNNTGTFSLCTTIPGAKLSTPAQTPDGSGTTEYSSTFEAALLAGRLPLAFVADGPLTSNTCPTTASTCTSESCTIVAMVNIPGQNLNNARAINFAGTYHNGACVPAPTCPQGMTPNLFVIPLSVSGNYYGNTSVYPIESFTAYMRPSDGVPVLSQNMPQCLDGASPATSPCQNCASGDTACQNNPANKIDPNGKYWRVCLYIVTEEGTISKLNNTSAWNSDSGSVMAATRCVPTNEPSGSGFSVFIPD